MNKGSRISNHELMERVKNSDHQAFNILYERLWEVLYIKTYSILGDKNIAKDIVQDVWISLWERRDKVVNDNIKGYLIRAVRLKVYNEFRNSKYKSQLIQEFIQTYNSSLETNSVEQSMQFKETESRILKAVNRLPKKCKQVFELSRYDGLKNEEIAEKLNISRRTVETHISNALKVLKNNIALGLAMFLDLF